MGTSKHSRKKKAANSANSNSNSNSVAKPNGTTNKSLRASTPAPKTAAAPARSSRSILSVIGRILAWYTLYTVLFRCPTYPTSESPTICHGYTQLRNILAPHLEPYYDTYASAYVERFTPYMSEVNEAYIYPAVGIASANYEKYAQPTIVKLKAITEKEYQEKLQPHVVKTSTQLNALYNQHISPYSEKLYHLYGSAASSPYWSQVRGHAEGVYTVYLVPAYKQTLPYINRAIENARRFVILVVGPYVKEGARVSGDWLEKNVLSRINGIWREYVEVQVGRIRERLTTGSNTDGYAHSISQSGDSFDSPDTSSVPSSAAITEEESPERKAAREAARKQIEEDLAYYNDKFEKHANEAIQSLHSRVGEIATTAMESKRPAIAEDIKKLDKLIDNETKNLKAKIMNLARVYKPGSTEEESKANKLAGFDKLFEATNKAATLVKDTAQELRWDLQRFLAEVYDEVAAVVDTHVEKIDALIDAGIGELGMKWAWKVDGVTYKDWARYHDLKKEFSGVRAKVIKSTEKNEKLIEVTKWAEGEDFEAGVIKRATSAALELARLKRVGKKKIELGDSSDDFSDKYIIPAEKQKLYNTEAQVAQTTASVGEEPSKDSVTRVAIGKANAAVVDEGIVEHDTLAEDTLTEKLKDAVDEVKDAVNDRLSHASRAVSEAIYGTPVQQPVGESIISIANDLYSSALSAASVALYGTPQAKGEAIVSIATDKYSAAVAAASQIIFGAEPTPAPLSEKAKIAYERAADHAAEAIEQVSEKVGEGVQSASSLAAEGYSSGNSVVAEGYDSASKAAKEGYNSASSVAAKGYSAASSVISSVMTPPPAIERILVSANAQIEDIVNAASERIYGREKGTVEKATSAAAEVYASVQSRVSEAVYGKEAGVFESAMSRLSHAASSASKDISIAVYGTPESGFEKATRVVQENIEAATSVVGEKVEVIKNVVEERVLGAFKTKEEEEYYAKVVKEAQEKIGRAVESAASRLRTIYDEAKQAMANTEEKVGDKVGEGKKLVEEKVHKVVDTVGTAANSMTQKAKEMYHDVKEEL